MDSRDKLNNVLWRCTLCAAMFLAVMHAARAESTPLPCKIGVLQFDGIIELNAPLCRTHIVLFARYWVSPELYRVAVVWTEPHVGSLNFPLYPPTLNVVSEREAFRINHQFHHLYDGVFSKLVGERGPFVHKFNSYYFSDIRFAEQEALDLRIYARDIPALQKDTGFDLERVFDVPIRRPSDTCKDGLDRLNGRSTKGRLDELRLLNSQGELFKSVRYEYAQQADDSFLHRQIVTLPERPITVGFKGKGPTITIGQEKRQYSQLQISHHQGGRQCVVEYQSVQMDAHRLAVPARVTVYRADTMRLLRSARLSNFRYFQLTPDELKESAEEYSFFDDEEMKCHELLLKYWVKDPADVNQTDRKTLEDLRTHFADAPLPGSTVGEQLRRVNVRLQLDWMLDNAHGLVQNFQEYVSLLATNHLDRMILVGGQHAIEMTIRWGQLDAANNLLETWLLAGASQNSVESIPDFAADNLRKDSYWTTVKLLDKVLQTRQLSNGKRFVAQSLRCLGLARLHEMVKDPSHIKTELGIAQAWWVSSHMNTDALHQDLLQTIREAKQLFTDLDQPTRQQKTLRAQIEKINLEAVDAEPNDPNNIRENRTRVLK